MGYALSMGDSFVVCVTWNSFCLTGSGRALFIWQGETRKLMSIPVSPRRRKSKMIIVCECGTSWEFDGDSECPDCHRDCINPTRGGRQTEIELWHDGNKIGAPWLAAECPVCGGTNGY
jgi:hypothetical protein